MMCDDAGPCIPSVERQIDYTIDSMLHVIADWDNLFSVFKIDEDRVVYTYFDTFRLDENELVVHQTIYRKRRPIIDLMYFNQTMPEAFNGDPKQKYILVSEEQVQVPLSAEQAQRLKDATKDWYENRLQARKERERRERGESVREQLRTFNNRM